VRARSGVALFAILLSGCAADTTPLAKPGLAQAQNVPSGYSREADSAAPGDLSQWWRRFGDPTLITLAERTLAANQDIAQAAARLEQAEAQERGARANRLPTLNVSLDASRTLIRPAGTLGARAALTPELDFGWDPDFAGGLRNANRSAHAQRSAAGYDLASVQRATVASVAASYISYRGLDARIANAQAALTAQGQLLDVLRHRFAMGIAIASDVEQARLQYLQVAALIPQLTDARNQAANSVAVLTGTPPGQLGHLLDGPAIVPVATAVPATGIPADLLRRRPDLLAAQNQVLAAAATIGVARASLYPQMTLGGVISASAASLPGLAETLVSSLIGHISQALFDGGRARAAVAQSRGAMHEALAAYRGAILTALQDVENALSATQAANERVHIDQQACDAAQRNAKAIRGQYDIGLTDLFMLLDAEQQLRDERDELIVAQTDRVTAATQLYVALGGGW
jgi:NodT family efflux transporter outer membrane factor (OMF) lipoprotein